MSTERAYQLVVFSGEEIRAFDLPAAGEVTIGRDEASTVCIDDPSVSRRHAVLRVGETLEVEDLGGPNGTFVRQTARPSPGNDTAHVNIRQLLGRKANLTVGDCLLFGTACVVVRHPPRLDLPELVPADASGAVDAGGVVVRAPAMRALYADAARVARASINVLLLGETGVGKEILARAIHAHSPRAQGPFVGINCAALSESLLESELFGSDKGAFTGAVARAGLFEAGNGGTVFLDEVGELPLGTQAKLLRVLEERVVTRLGSTRARPIDVRFVAATNRDIEADSRQGRLRPDLYFRLNGAALLIPPLRERAQEIEALAASFLSAACRDMGRAPSCGAGGTPVAGGPGGSQIAGAAVRVCSLSDPKCAVPLAAGTTDDSGAVTLSVDTSLYRPPLAVFLEYRKQGFLDSLEQLIPPLTTDIDLGRVTMWDLKANFEPTAAALGITYDLTRANAGVFVSDCNGQPAIKKTAVTWLDRDAATVSEGYFAYTACARALNLPVDRAAITRIVARVADTSQLIATASVVVRPNTTTGVHLVPAP